MAQPQNETLINKVLAALNVIKNNLKDLSVDLHIYNHKANNVALDENFNYQDSANANLEELCERTTSQLETDINLTLSTTKSNIETLKELIIKIEDSPKSEELLLQIKKELGYGCVIKMQPKSTHPVYDNVLAMMLDNIAKFLKTINSNKFTKDVIKVLADLNSEALNIFENQINTELSTQ